MNHDVPVQHSTLFRSVRDRKPAVRVEKTPQSENVVLLRQAMNRDYLDLVLQVVKRLVNETPTEKKYGPRTALLWSVEQGCYDLTEYLLLRKANPNFRTSAGYTALEIAYDQGHFDIAKLLILFGACSTSKKQKMVQFNENQN